MRTVRSAISETKKGINKVNADARITNKEVYTKLLKHAEWLISRDSDAFRLGRKQVIYQDYKCAEVIDVPKIDPCCSITSKTVIKRTRDKIPEVFEDTNGPIIKGVFSVDGSQTIKFSTLSDYRAKKNNPYGPKTNYYFYKDGYLYGDLPRVINVPALYKEDITSLNQCESCGDVKDCTPFLDRKWVVPEYLQAQVIDFVIKDFIPQLQIPNQERIDKNENRG